VIASRGPWGASVVNVAVCALWVAPFGLGAMFALGSGTRRLENGSSDVETSDAALISVMSSPGTSSSTVASEYDMPRVRTAVTLALG
jgi:hypothetical protein